MVKEKTMNVNKTYGLRHKTEGWLMTVDETSNGSAENCGDSTVSFEGKDGSRIYETNKLNNAIASLSVPRDWYISSTDRPENVLGNGAVSPEMANFEVVEIVKTATAVDVEIPPYITTVGKFKFDASSKDKKEFGAKYGWGLLDGAEVKVGDRFMTYDACIEEVVKVGLQNELRVILTISTEKW